MKHRVHNSPNLIYSVGTQVVALKQVQGTNGKAVHPAGAVGVIVRAPRDRTHSYRVRFADGFEAALHHDNLMLLAEYKQGAINDSSRVLSTHGLAMPWDEVEAWRLSLHAQFDRALEETTLSERPDYERVNDFLIRARRSAVDG